MTHEIEGGNESVFAGGCVSYRTNIAGLIRIYQVDGGYQVKYEPCGMFAGRKITPKTVGVDRPIPTLEIAHEWSDALKAWAIAEFNRRK